MTLLGLFCDDTVTTHRIDGPVIFLLQTYDPVIFAAYERPDGSVYAMANAQPSPMRMGTTTSTRSAASVPKIRILARGALGDGVAARGKLCCLANRPAR
jgi:hypothetical protein